MLACGCLYTEVKNKLGMFLLNLTFCSFWKHFMYNKVTPMSYFGLKSFIKDRRIWALI